MRHRDGIFVPVLACPVTPFARRVFLDTDGCYRIDRCGCDSRYFTQDGVSAPRPKPGTGIKAWSTTRRRPATCSYYARDKMRRGMACRAQGCEKPSSPRRCFAGRRDGDPRGESR